ncbi:MAG: hypothetical protein AAB731_00315 [Patescibacteria group bacterium]
MGMDELKKIYSDAWDAGIWIREWGPPPGGAGYLAAAGGVKKLKEAEKKLGKEIDHTKLEMLDCMNLGALPGVGKTRKEACSAAVAAYKEYYNVP